VGFHSDNEIIADWDCDRIDLGQRSLAAHLHLHQPQDDVGIALAGAAQGSQLVDDGGLDPDQPLAPGVWLRLTADGAERERRGDRLEGGLGDGDADRNGKFAALAYIRPMIGPLPLIAGLLGLLFLFVAAMYSLVPAGDLPSFFPGFEADSAQFHVKHAIGSLVIALVLFAFSWRQVFSRERR
jgi:hypothetical protein